MFLGIDLDNTLVRYDRLFQTVFEEQGWAERAGRLTSKEAIRDYLRGIGREEVWTEMQGTVYGGRMGEAEPFPGALEFLARCAERGIPHAVISHRSLRPYRGEPYDLHQAARDWLYTRGITSTCQSGRSGRGATVYLETTLVDKLRRVAAVGCTHFIDDLPEVLTHAEFPPGVERILFDPHARHAGNTQVVREVSWEGLRNRFFRDGGVGDQNVNLKGET